MLLYAFGLSAELVLLLSGFSVSIDRVGLEKGLVSVAFAGRHSTVAAG